MDGSLLSDAGVIEASRSFVCIRTATYEDREEADFQKETFFGGEGDLRNFGYAVLAPDGKRKLKRSRRGPNFVYRDAKDMAADLRRLADPYRKTANANKKSTALPAMKSVRLGLNVASCDGLPFVVVVGKTRRDLDGLQKKLAGAVWKKDLIGKFIFASTTEAKDLASIKGATFSAGIMVIKPDAYGVKGTVITEIGLRAGADKLEKTLLGVAAKFVRTAKSHRDHVRQGRRAGLEWKTEVPVPSRRRSRR